MINEEFTEKHQLIPGQKPCTARRKLLSKNEMGDVEMGDVCFDDKNS